MTETTDVSAEQGLTDQASAKVAGCGFGGAGEGVGVARAGFGAAS